jgi:hypothetical protein
VIYVPIKAPAITFDTPIAASHPHPPPPAHRSVAQRAGAAIVSTLTGAGNATFATLPNTSVPLWWVLLMLLAVPFARLWRRWTARMFR